METKKHSPIVYKVYRELKKHIGEDNAISNAELARIVGTDERGLREIIAEIIESEELRKLPCSTVKGYFLATDSDFIKQRTTLWRRAISSIKRVKAFEKKGNLDGQMLIPQGDYWQEVYEVFLK